MRRWLIEVVILATISAAVVVFVADFAYGMSVTWSRFPLSGIGFLAISGLLIIAFSSSLYWLVALETIAAAFFLYLMDIFTPGNPWFVPLGLPLTLLTGSFILAVMALGQKLALSPLSVAATSVFVAGLLALAAELVINRFLIGVFFVSWSLVAFGCVFALLPFFLILRRWLRKNRPEIRKMFHL
jgi:hypothetical protein